VARIAPIWASSLACRATVFGGEYGVKYLAVHCPPFGNLRPVVGIALQEARGRRARGGVGVARAAGCREVLLDLDGVFPSAQVKVLRCEAGYEDTGRMIDDTARDRAIYQALKAADEVAAGLQAHLIEEHGADLDRAAAQSSSTDSFKLLRQARERLGEGLRGVGAGDIGDSDEISLRGH
jgi:hypothetical protein